MSIHWPNGVVHMSVPTMPHLPDEWKDEGEYGFCCGAAVHNGPEYCTCWEPMFDLEQQELRVVDRDLALRFVREKQCIDCAYRADSPERTGDDTTRENLMDLPYGDNPFWCHQGIRRPTGFRHPDGRTLGPVGDEDYRPPEANRVPYRADGTPAEVCAGWAARHDKASGVVDS